MKYLVLGCNRGNTCSFIYEPASLANPEIVGKEIEEKFISHKFFPTRIDLIPFGNAEMVTVLTPENGNGWSFSYNNSHRYF